MLVILRSTLSFCKKHFLHYGDKKRQNQCLLIKTTHAVVDMHSLLCVFVSQYSNKVDLIWPVEAEMRGQRRAAPIKLRARASLHPWSHSFIYSFISKKVDKTQLCSRALIKSDGKRTIEKVNVIIIWKR